MARRAGKLKSDPIATELSRLRGEVVAMGEHVISLRRELSAALRPTPEAVAGDHGDTIGVVEASRQACRSAATLRRLIDSGAPIGRFDHVTGRYLCSRREMRDYFQNRYGKVPPPLRD